MRRATLRRSCAALAAVTSFALAVTACGGTTKSDVKDDSASAATSGKADPNAELKKGLTVGFLPKQVNNPYFTSADKGGEAALKELGSSYKEVGPSSATDTSGQVNYVNTLTQQQVDAMAVSAQDPGALCTALKQAMSNDIKVVTYDSDTKPECRNAFVSQASAEDLGRTEVQLLAEQIGFKGEIAVLSAAQTATNQNVWIDFMKKELEDPKYKDIKLVKVAYGDDDAQKSFQQTQGLLQEYPNLKGIISPTTVGIKAAAQYLSGSKYKGKVKLTGLGTPNDMRKYVKDGTVEGFELWDPAKLGELAARTAVALASGQITGKEGETFTAGAMGEYTIGKDGVISLGKPTVFNKANIDKFDF
ncbi:rhamnose ABC transporter substrate-binding protein [Streptomyces europaeiscabiei]|uniref:Rhamnose ABC transporter substrate-binding protein n=1 Tax=Streptomyces europaeiscabiei TaxID=146819 RepID=A0ABU4NM36_9ACTN|nr:rhamnose ABC transporter substrate-binding protein [Streptomyces europaeiscabiei]MDX2527524.1 rhamnose ABC transporter substrate-binding protein [Streptomyces europaeiscabiei]MDX2758943.1 rhamnose ABC transporter substrate-binding protein [Streptomyces europaeiscabiei]MDX2769199.1 rhamnose ABC transporter substrate-binding protein [Streptomyces europaeiscabiei]MDX3545889.1 rhamnose ABC transporter substrate-binding protein [Streptomyces europaeiscabiei]MDX3555578.1 rhamnose ABC transporter 